MPRSVRSLIHKCLHKGAITQEEHDKILRKLDKVQEWIPCSERPPEENQGVFLTVETVSGHRDVLPSIATYHKGHWWWLDNDKLGNNVIAWMPRPEPYHEQ